MGKLTNSEKKIIRILESLNFDTIDGCIVFPYGKYGKEVVKIIKQKS
ncbi:MAG: hypothetical protein K5917_00755 [Clostridiales bacterium]|nr:hypothetical protein [Clostridiales bacterium]